MLIKNLSFTELMNQLKFEGHPAIWYILLFPFVKLGAPVIVQNILSSLFAFAATYLLLFNSPFRNDLKLVFVASSPILFSYSVIGRSYSLVLLFLIIILTIFKERYGKYFILYAASLAVLINTELYSAIIAGAFIASDIVVILIIKKDFSQLKKILAICVVVALSAALLFITIYPGQYYSTYLNQTTNSNALLLFSKIFYYTFTVAYKLFSSILGVSSITGLFATASFVICAFLFWLVYTAIKSKSKDAYYSFVFFIVFTLTLYGVVLFTKRFGTQHGGILLLIFWSTVWILKLASAEQPKYMKRFLAIFSILMILFSCSELVNAVTDITKPYSGSKAAAEFLIHEGYDYEDTLLITTDAPETSGILLYLKNIQQDKSPDGFMSYVDWRLWHNDEYASITTFDFDQLIGADYTNYKHIILVADESRFSSNETLPYEEIYSNIGSGIAAQLENFRVYLAK